MAATFLGSIQDNISFENMVRVLILQTCNDFATTQRYCQIRETPNIERERSFLSPHQCNKVVSKKYNRVVCAIVHKFAYIKTIECNNVVYFSIGFACSSWNFVKRYDLVVLSKIHVCNKVVTMIQHCCTDATLCSLQHPPPPSPDTKDFLYMTLV